MCFIVHSPPPWNFKSWVFYRSPPPPPISNHVFYRSLPPPMGFQVMSVLSFTPPPPMGFQIMCFYCSLPPSMKFQITSVLSFTPPPPISNHVFYCSLPPHGLSNNECFILHSPPPPTWDFKSCVLLLVPGGGGGEYLSAVCVDWMLMVLPISASSRCLSLLDRVVLTADDDSSWNSSLRRLLLVSL